MWRVNRIIRCKNWEELKELAKRYTEMGFRCEVRGWLAISSNTLTILDDWDDSDLRIALNNNDRSDTYGH